MAAAMAALSDSAPVVSCLGKAGIVSRVCTAFSKSGAMPCASLPMIYQAFWVLSEVW